jgi:excinuclease ABC subunit A
MVLDQEFDDSFLVEFDVSNYWNFVSESRTQFIFFQFTKGACDHCNGLGTVNEINRKRLFKSKIIDKSRWFCSLGEYKSLGCLSN